MKSKKLKTWAVTGTFHGSIVSATSEGQARRIFHKNYNGESIVSIRESGRSYIVL